ncbi:hypothetical protein [Azonexus sp.]|uniref:hypothetical protein n=1 Tax=Azonexus sp. TaxID=1872668 RepID=UPI0039E27D19
MNEDIFRIARFQARELLTRIFNFEECMDDHDMILIMDAFAQATQLACPLTEGLYQAVIDESFETFNQFCIEANPNNTRSENLKYFKKLLPKKPKSSKAMT